MSESSKDLGKLIAVYSIAPVYVQRAVFTVVLSFIFFMAMMFAFYIRQSLGYFLLSSAFLAIYLLTMFSWVSQRKNVVKIYENGIEYKKFSTVWNEIETVKRTGTSQPFSVEVQTTTGSIVLPSSISGLDEIESTIQSHIAA